MDPTIHDALDTSHGTISNTLQRAEKAGLDWAAVQALSDAELETKIVAQDHLYPPRDIRRHGVG